MRSDPHNSKQPAMLHHRSATSPPRRRQERRQSKPVITIPPMSFADDDSNAERNDGKSSSIDPGETELKASDPPIECGRRNGRDSGGGGSDSDEEGDEFDDCSAGSDECILEGKKYQRRSLNFKFLDPRGEGESTATESAEDESQETGNKIDASPAPTSTGPGQSKATHLFSNWVASSRSHVCSDTKATMSSVSSDTSNGGRFGGLAAFGKKFSWNYSSDTSKQAHTKKSAERQASIAGGCISLWDIVNKSSGGETDDEVQVDGFSTRRRSSSTERNYHLSNSFRSIFPAKDQNDAPSKQPSIKQTRSSLPRSFSNLGTSNSKPANIHGLDGNGFTITSRTDKMSHSQQRSLSFYESEDLWKEFRHELEANRITNAVGVKAMFAKFVEEKLASENHGDETIVKTTKDESNVGNDPVLPRVTRRNSCFGRYITVNPLSDEVNKNPKTVSAEIIDNTASITSADGCTRAYSLDASSSTRGKQDLNSSSSSLWSDPDLSFTSKVVRDQDRYQNVIRGDATRMSLKDYDDNGDGKDDGPDEELLSDDKPPRSCDSDDSEERWGKINKNYEEKNSLDRSENSSNSTRGLLDLSWRKKGVEVGNRDFRNSIGNLDLSWRRGKAKRNCEGDSSLSRSYTGNSSSNGALDLSWKKKEAGKGVCGRRNSVGDVNSSWTRGAASKNEEKRRNSFQMPCKRREAKSGHKDDEEIREDFTVIGLSSFARLSLFKSMNLNWNVHSTKLKQDQENEANSSCHPRPILVRPIVSSDLSPQSEAIYDCNGKHEVQGMGLPNQSHTKKSNEIEVSSMEGIKCSKQEGLGLSDEIINEKGGDVVGVEELSFNLNHFNSNENNDCEFYDTDEIDQECDIVVETPRIAPRRSSLRTGSFTHYVPNERVHNELEDNEATKIELLQCLLGGTDNSRAQHNMSASCQQLGTSPVASADQGINETVPDAEFIAGENKESSQKLISSQQMLAHTKRSGDEHVSVQSSHGPGDEKSHKSLQKSNSQKLMSILLGSDDNDTDTDDSTAERMQALHRPVPMKYKPKRKQRNRRKSIRRSGGGSTSSNDDISPNSSSDKNFSSAKDSVSSKQRPMKASSRSMSESTNGSLLVEWGESYDPNED